MEQRRILLVEDDARLRGLVRRYLIERGHRVVGVGSVAEAVAALEHDPPDLMLLDIQLPDGSGWEAARWARDRAPRTAIVVCSSHEPSVEEAEGYSIEGYIPKPFDVRSLPDLLETALTRGAAAYSPVGRRATEDEAAAFYSSLAHDMRTPMATLQTAVESLLCDDVEWDAEARREFLEAIASSSERVGRYARDVVDLARLEAGAARARRETLDPHETIEPALRGLRARGGIPAVAIRVGTGVSMVQADPGHVQRILVALLENAVVHSPAGAPVGLEVTRAGSEVQWRISDAGAGIPREDRERVFDRAYRVGRPTGPTGGPRISLYLCRQLALLQGGRLWVEDADGSGCCFCLALPTATPTGDNDGAHPDC